MVGPILVWETVSCSWVNNWILTILLQYTLQKLQHLKTCHHDEKISLFHKWCSYFHLWEILYSVIHTSWSLWSLIPPSAVPLTSKVLLQQCQNLLLYHLSLRQFWSHPLHSEGIIFLSCFFIVCGHNWSQFWLLLLFIRSYSLSRDVFLNCHMNCPWLPKALFRHTDIKAFWYLSGGHEEPSVHCIYWILLVRAMQSSIFYEK